MEIEVIRRFEFEILEEAKSTAGRFVDFYYDENIV
jgi:hypothetical protein